MPSPALPPNKFPAPDRAIQSREGTAPQNDETNGGTKLPQGQQ
jgi:hypothetical protein